MESGLAHEKAIVEIIEQASGCPTITTAQALTQAFDQVGIKKLVLISPYVQATNQLEVNYLQRDRLHRAARERAGARIPRLLNGHAGGVEKSGQRESAAPTPTAIF